MVWIMYIIKKGIFHPNFSEDYKWNAIVRYKYVINGIDPT